MGSGRRAAAAGWSPPEAPAAVYPRRPVWLFVVRLRRSGGSGVPTRVPGGGRGARGPGTGRGVCVGGAGSAERKLCWECGRGRAGERAAGRASSLHCARRPRRRPRGVLQPGPLRRPAGQLPRRRALAAPASARGPQPRSRRTAPGRWGSGSSGSASSLPRDAPLPSPKVVPRTPELGSGKARKCAGTRSRPRGVGAGSSSPLLRVYLLCVVSL